MFNRSKKRTHHLQCRVLRVTVVVAESKMQSFWSGRSLTRCVGSIVSCIVPISTVVAEVVAGIIEASINSCGVYLREFPMRR